MPSPIALMSRLTYPLRFALIGAVFALTLFYLTWGLFSNNQNTINFSAKELQGAHYIMPFPALLEAIQNRGSGVGSDADAENALAAVRTLETQDPDALGTAKAFKELERSWKESQAGTSHGDSRIAANAALASSALQLLNQACDGSNLTLDPDLDSYYLMDNACTRLPGLTNRTGEAAALAILPVDHGMTTGRRERLIELRPLIRDSLASWQANQGKVNQANASVATAFGTLVTMVPDTVSTTMAPVSARLAEAASFDPAMLASANKTLQSRLKTAQTTTHAELQRLLQIRIDGIRWQRNGFILTAALSLLITFALFAVLYRSITRELGGEPFFVMSAIKNIAEGRLDIPVTADITEPKSLLASTVEMRLQLRSIISDVLSVAERIESSSQIVAGNGEHLATTGQEQHAAADAIAAAISGLSDNINQCAQLAAASHRLIDTTEQQTTQGNGAMTRTAQEMDAVARQVNEAATIIEALGERARDISKVVNVIRDVAEQTDMLALNAAIEAARAGETGRGFAVVADEVRNLAERTTRSSHEIHQIVSAMQSTTGNAVDIIRQSREQAGDSAGRCQTTVDTMNAICDEIQRTRTAIEAIAESLVSQKASGESVTVNIDDMVKRLGDSRQRLSRNHSEVVELRMLAQQLAAVTRGFTL